MVRIYTRTGDSGETSLWGGRRVSKASPRVEAYGAVDECNSALGLALSHLQHEELRALLLAVQRDLFRLGAELATEPGGKQGETISESDGRAMVERLEQEIDRLEEELKPLRHFILPGGGTTGAHLHMARVICRRAERQAVALGAQESLNPVVIKYLNRLSDFLFVLARAVNQREGAGEEEWRGLEGG